jgi:hypothetical protein
MREFHVTMSVDNDAFTELPEHEIARILRSVAIQLEQNGLPMVTYGVRDINGNVVGHVGMTVSADEIG